MISVVIIGYGNVGQALGKAIEAVPGFEICQLYCRNKERISEDLPYPVVFNPGEIKEADLYLISVSDDAITEVSNKLPFTGRLVAHTSGSVPLSALNPEQNRAVFYPLQSFTKDKQITWSEVPICLEAENENDRNVLEKLAKGLSEKVYWLNSDQRKRLHLAAVFVNNFVNHMYHLGASYCREHNIPFEILHPLILETAGKIQELSPYDAQTGPARRNDQKTLNSQLLQLKDSPMEEVYKTITSSIIATYEREKL